jgi:hypothetical protein
MDAGHGAGRGAIDLAETGVGVGTAYESGMERAGEFHVIDELGPPRQQGRILETRDSCAELLRAQTPSLRGNRTRLPLPRLYQYPPPAEAREERRTVHHAFYNYLILRVNSATLPKQRGVAISGACGQWRPANACE